MHMYVCIRIRHSPHPGIIKLVEVFIYVFVYIYVCIRMRVNRHYQAEERYLYVFVYIYVCIRMCVYIYYCIRILLSPHPGIIQAL